jgi:hypothetical protein
MDGVTANASDGGVETEAPRHGRLAAVIAMALSLISIVIGGYAVYETREFRKTIESQQHVDGYWRVLREITKNNVAEGAPYNCNIDRGTREVAIGELESLLAFAEVRRAQKTSHLPVLAASQFCAERYAEAVETMRDATKHSTAVRERILVLAQLGFMQMARADGQAAPDSARELFLQAQQLIKPPGVAAKDITEWRAWLLRTTSIAEYAGGDKQASLEEFVESQNLRSDLVLGRSYDASRLCEDNERMVAMFGAWVLESLKFKCSQDDFGSAIVTPIPKSP